MMIGEGPFLRDLYSTCAQRPEEPRGIANPGKGQYPLAVKRGNRCLVSLQMRRQNRFSARRDGGGHRCRSTSLADNDQGIGASDLWRQRRAQGACRKHASVAEATN